MDNKVTKKLISLLLIVTGRYNFNPNGLYLYLNHPTRGKGNSSFLIFKAELTHK